MWKKRKEGRFNTHVSIVSILVLRSITCYRRRDPEKKLKDGLHAFQCCKNELAKQLRDRIQEREQSVS